MGKVGRVGYICPLTGVKGRGALVERAVPPLEGTGIARVRGGRTAALVKQPGRLSAYYLYSKKRPFGWRREENGVWGDIPWPKEASGREGRVRANPIKPRPNPRRQVREDKQGRRDKDRRTLLCVGG